MSSWAGDGCRLGRLLFRFLATASTKVKLKEAGAKIRIRIGIQCQRQVIIEILGFDPGAIFVLSSNVQFVDLPLELECAESRMGEWSYAIWVCPWVFKKWALIYIRGSLLYCAK